MSAFDDIDRRHRMPKKPEIKLEPLEDGCPCADPKCGGALRLLPFSSNERRVFQCDRCNVLRESLP